MELAALCATGIPSSASASTSTSHSPSYEGRCRAASEASRMTPEQHKKLFQPRSLAAYKHSPCYIIRCHPNTSISRHPLVLPKIQFQFCMHAPPKKLSKEERDAWDVPACISNWKNSRGYTIPLDKRLAADGRGLKEHSINSNFATLSESLYVAEKQARQEVRLRAQVQSQLAAQEKEAREEELRQLAKQARMERSGSGAVVFMETNKNIKNMSNNNNIPTKLPIPSDESDNDTSNDEDDNDEQVAAKQRERLRLERKKERVKEVRLENNMQAKKARMEQERDVSEKIALGVHTGTGGGGQVDSRLYNQSAGMDSGFGAEDEYNTYTKPLFDREGVSSSSIYRPTRGETEHTADEQYDTLLQGATNKFQPNKGFAGAGSGGGSRSAPVQFEKDATKIDY